MTWSRINFPQSTTDFQTHPSILPNHHSISNPPKFSKTPYPSPSTHNTTSLLQLGTMAKQRLPAHKIKLATSQSPIHSDDNPYIYTVHAHLYTAIRREKAIEDTASTSSSSSSALIAQGGKVKSHGACTARDRVRQGFPVPRRSPRRDGGCGTFNFPRLWLNEGSHRPGRAARHPSGGCAATCARRRKRAREDKSTGRRSRVRVTCFCVRVCFFFQFVSRFGQWEWRHGLLSGCFGKWGKYWGSDGFGNIGFGRLVIEDMDRHVYKARGRRARCLALVWACKDSEFQVTWNKIGVKYLLRRFVIL